MSSNKHKGLHGLKSWQNGNYLATDEGKKAYDNELARLQENRKRFTQYIKDRPPRRSEERFD